MRYRISRIVPVRCRSTCTARISTTEMDEGGHGNHFAAGPHADHETFSWWQWRDRIWRCRTTRVCVAS